MNGSTGSRAMNIRPSTLLAGLAAVLFLVLLPDSSPAQELRAEAAVEKLQVYVGESFVLQIQIKGSETPERSSVRAAQVPSSRSSSVGEAMPTYTCFED